MKTVTTCLGSLNNTIIYEKFDEYPADVLTRKEIHTQHNTDWSVDSHYKIANQLGVFNTSLKTNQAVVEQHLIDRQVVMLRCIGEGSVKRKQGKELTLLVPGNVYVSYHPCAASCEAYNIGTTQSSFILLSARFYTQLL